MRYLGDKEERIEKRLFCYAEQFLFKLIHTNGWYEKGGSMEQKKFGKDF